MPRSCAASVYFRLVTAAVLAVTSAPSRVMDVICTASCESPKLPRDAVVVYLPYSPLSAPKSMVMNGLPLSVFFVSTPVSGARLELRRGEVRVDLDEEARSLQLGEVGLVR